MTNAREVIAFLVCAAAMPCLFLGMTGTPGALVAWVAAWIIINATGNRHVR